MNRLMAAALCLGLAGPAFAETASVIDPTEGIEAPRQDAAMPRAPSASPRAPAVSPPDAALRRERQRADAEQRRRARAEARAAAAERRLAEREAARQAALEQARQAEAAREAAQARESVARARKSAEIRAATARAIAAKAAAARHAAERAAAEHAATEREAATREAAARELAERQEAERQAAAKEAAARESAQREAQRQAVAKEAAERLISTREAMNRERARDLAQHDNAVRFAATARDPREGRLRKAPPPRIGTVFRDCSGCPELVWLPPGEFAMGEGNDAARPVVAIDYAIAVGRFEVTFAEWDACAAAGGCRRRPSDAGWGRGLQPVINVSWSDAQQYAAWLSRRTGKRYRLLTEAEWEYAARAGTAARYWWGDRAGRGDANCADCGSEWGGRQAAPVGRFPPNPFGLYDMHGNVSEWVEDCYDARGCGSGGGETRIVRGGAWYGSQKSMRSTFRSPAVADYADNGIGFRIARTD